MAKVIFQGDGYGYGSGYGDGYGDGSGDGYGDGYGYGSGYGDGDGYGDIAYWRQCIPIFSAAWPQNQLSRLAAAEREGAVIAYWCSDHAGQPCNGGSGPSVKPGHIDVTTGPLDLCSAGTLHATLLPPRWRGERWWIVALWGETVGAGEKFGALKREILGEAIWR